MRSHKHIESHIEFFMADEERIVNIPLDDVGLRLVGDVCPLADIGDGSEEEDALALASADLNGSEVTGFIIQTPFCYLHLLNYSLKMGY